MPKNNSATARTQPRPKTTDARSAVYQLPPRPGTRRPIGGVRVG